MLPKMVTRADDSPSTVTLPPCTWSMNVVSPSTIEMSVLSTAGQTDYNYVGTYTAGSTLAATTMNIGVEGSQGGAENFGGTWTVGTTAIGFAASAANNYLTITDGGTYTNSSAFTVGVSGSY